MQEAALAREDWQDLDAERRAARLSDDDALARDPPAPPRAFIDRAEEPLAPVSRPLATRQPKVPPGPSDRVLHAVIMERLDDERRLDLRDVQVTVEGAEVTLDGTVQHKADKRRIEDVADIDGVRNVQNNLRVRDPGHWTFL
jgi:hypothetical protein